MTCGVEYICAQLAERNGEMWPPPRSVQQLSTLFGGSDWNLTSYEEKVAIPP